jgi:putative adenylate-forming enzyme
MKRIFLLLFAYWRTRRLRFTSRAALERYQAGRIARLTEALCARSRYFAPFRALPLAQWPIMDKALMLANFDTMNTAGLVLEQTLDVALRAEHSRDFTPTIGAITVGLSSGTTSRRAVFAVSEEEKARWAGVMLAKALPDGLLSGERIALLLRANSNLYTAVRTPWLSFSYFDLFQPIDALARAVVEYHPTIIVAPAQVLRHLALGVIEGRLALAPKKVISVAEVLDAQDKAIIAQAFGTVHEIYQATEGFLASTCEHGVLHLNEEYVRVEAQWLDEHARRFVPIITDFSRLTQPIVRYRLDDVLVARDEPCPCGRASRALARIEGRCDDMLELPGSAGEPITVFADMLTRALAQVLPFACDYRLVQLTATELSFRAALDTDAFERVRLHLNAVLRALGVDAECLKWTHANAAPTFDSQTKRRRIVRHRPGATGGDDDHPTRNAEAAMVAP